MQTAAVTAAVLRRKCLQYSSGKLVVQIKCFASGHGSVELYMQ